MKQILLFLMIVLSIASCQKELDTGAFQVKPYFDAHKSQGQWTQNRIFDSLIGTWQWQFRACESSRTTSSQVSEDLIVRFDRDSSLTAIKNGITAKTRFSIAVEDRVDFAVVQDSFIALLGGRIYFFKDKVVFNQGYIDGCDNYFIRVK